MRQKNKICNFWTYCPVIQLMNQQVSFRFLKDGVLRILAMYEAKNSKICNFWTIWPVIQLINDHLQIWLRWFISWITGPIVQKLQILLFFASYIATETLYITLFHIATCILLTLKIIRVIWVWSEEPLVCGTRQYVLSQWFSCQSVDVKSNPDLGHEKKKTNDWFPFIPLLQTFMTWH